MAHLTVLPEHLTPAKLETLRLPSGRTIDIPICNPSFQRWSGTPINSYGGKPLLDLEGESLYAELVVLRLFQNMGWNGVWVDSYGKKYRTSPVGEPESVIPVSALMKEPPYLEYPKAFSKFGGAWDVVVCNNDVIVFCECKRKSKDSIRGTQLVWLENRLSDGATAENFLLVEWSEADNSSE